MKILGPGLPGPKFAHPLMMKLFKRGTVKSAHGHGIGRHSEEEVKKIALADLKVSLMKLYTELCHIKNLYCDVKTH